MGARKKGQNVYTAVCVDLKSMVPRKSFKIDSNVKCGIVYVNYMYTKLYAFGKNTGKQTDTHLMHENGHLRGGGTG